LPLHALEATPTPALPLHALEATPTPALPLHALEATPTPALSLHALEATPTPALPLHALEATPTPALSLHALEATPTPALSLHALETAQALETAPSPASTVAQDCLKGFAQKTTLTALPVDHVSAGQALQTMQSPPRPVEHVLPDQALQPMQSPPRPVEHVLPGQALQPMQSPPRPVEHVLPGQALDSINNDRPRKAPKTTSPAMQYPWPTPLLPTHGLAGSAPGGPEDFSVALSALLGEVSCLPVPSAKKMDSDQPPPPPPPPSPELITGKTSATEQPVLAASTHVQRSTAEHLDSELPPPPPPPPLPSSEAGTEENLASDQPVSAPSTEIQAATGIDVLSWREVFTAKNPVQVPSTKIQASTSWLEVLTAKKSACDRHVSTSPRKIHRPSPQRPVSRSPIKKNTTAREDSMLLARNARQKWPLIKDKTTHMLQQSLASKTSLPVHDMFQQQLRAVKNGKAKDQKQALLTVLQYLHLQDIIMGKFAEDPFRDGFFGWNAFTVVKGAKFVDMLNILFAGLGHDTVCMAFRRCGFMVAPPHKFCHLLQGVGTAVWQQHQQDRYRAIS
jgi:hypothetical protein